MIKIGFWSKETGNMLSHRKGLTMEQIMALKELKEGDRLVLWRNERKNDTDTSYTLKKFEPREK